MLLLATLCIGIGAAMTNPAWQTAMVELVPTSQVPHAAALNSVSLNLSRTIGPAIGGLLIAAQGPAAAFTLNALSFIAFILVLWRWKYSAPKHAENPERVLNALLSGLNHIRNSPPVHALIVRTASYVLFASALWALLPLIARNELHVGATGYGWLLASLGLGAVVATIFLPRIRSKCGPNQVLAAAAILYGSMMAAIASLAKFRGDQPDTLLLAMPAMFFAGTAWLAMVVTINTNAQMISPPQFRGRVFACYLTVHFGTLAAGSLLWGVVAGRLGVPAALLIAAAGIALGLLTMLKYKIVEVSHSLTTQPTLGES
jgi:predicted MFS family arabinose efflux permease